jgi:hypothetical protein
MGFAVALIGALIGGGFSYLGAWQQIRSQEHTQTLQDTVERRKEDRDKRVSTYEEFINAADSYAVQTSEILATCKGKASCNPDFDKWDSARSAYQGAVNHVYVYGSDAAVSQSRRVSSTLPPSLWSPDPKRLKIFFHEADFTKAYDGFETLMCRELPADPRSGCGTL